MSRVRLVNGEPSILLVGTDKPAWESLAHELRERNYQVGVAGNGEQALALVRSASFDLLVIENEMPDLSGLDVLTGLRGKYTAAQLPVILATATVESEEVATALRHGANDYVAKPVDATTLVARMAPHLALKKAAARNRETEERYALAMQGANDGLWDWNLSTNELYWSPRWKSMLGYDDSEIDSSPTEWLDRVHPEDQSRLQEALAQHKATDCGPLECEHRIRHRDGSFRWVLCRGAAARSASGVATRWAGSLTDVTDIKISDPLTGLPNRTLFDDVLLRAIARSERRQNYVFALLACGLDRFTALNECLGRPTGDQVLIAVGRRLQGCLRATDTFASGRQGFTLARLGGDEFTVLLDDVDDASNAMAVAERLRAVLEEPFVIDGQEVFTSLSVGIAVSTTGYQAPEEALRDAEIALSRAKAGGGRRCELFDRAMRQRAVQRLRMEIELRRAIEQSAFELRYQPIVSLTSGVIVGFEALVRWQHPTQGLILPAEFIGVAEDTGMILEIGRHVLGESCRQLAAWQSRFGVKAPGALCVNVSNRQLTDPAFADVVEGLLEQSGVHPTLLKLEITESAFLKDLGTARTTMSRIQSMGIRWSLDDFGIGYSSLSYLQQLPVSTLKVDRSFVAGMGQSANGAEMVRAIVGLTHTLGMDVVAEGIETAEQAATLRSMGCEYAQGFFFSRPADAVTAGRFIGTQPWRGLSRPTLVASSVA